MTGPERGFLLLSSHLGNPHRKPLTHAQMRTLGQRMQNAPRPEEDRDLTPADLTALGYGAELAEQIVALLSEEELLDHYLRRAAKCGCVPITRVSPAYPSVLKEKLGFEAPGCLWAKGDLEILKNKRISLVGSRDLYPKNAEFAREAGRQAALQGFCLVSGNARGADRTAQEAALTAGGSVISIVADALSEHLPRKGVLYLSEDAFDEAFSPQRALSRNRCIHALGEKVLVAQCSYQQGGTWDGSVKNLRFSWSPLFCFRDGSPASQLLRQMGAELVTLEDLQDLKALQNSEDNFLAGSR
ncbi:MAG: DNA-protecting protein DprA [Oscillospiraceae bacterium]|nr:DNA-protecting protein DprA [Oscillospiraceae bacterium]